MERFNETFSSNLSIKQVAEIFRVSKSKLRFWEERGLINPVRNENNEYREYSRHTLTEIEDIIMLKSLGCSLDEIEHIKKAGVDETTRLLSVSRERLEQQRLELDRMIQGIVAREKLIEEYRHLKEKPDYRFCMPDKRPIIKWRWTDDNIHNYLAESYMVIVFYPEQEMHFSDGIYVSADDYEEDDLIWSPGAKMNPAIECLIETEYGNPSKNNIREHIDILREQGYRTGIVIAKFLVADISPQDGELHDYFKAMIEIIPKA